MLKRTKKQPTSAIKPIPKSPAFSLSALQQAALALVTAYKAIDPEDLNSAGPVEELCAFMELPTNTPIYMLTSAMLSGADFNIGCSCHRSREGTPWLHVSASYKEYHGYKLPWTETYGERPTMYYQSRQLLIAVAVCYLTLCLRTDKQLWLLEQTPPLSPSRPRLTRIKRAATPN